MKPSMHFGYGCRVRPAASRYASRGRKMKRASGWLRRGGLSWHGVRPVGDSREPPEIPSTASFGLGLSAGCTLSSLLIAHVRVLAYDDALQHEIPQSNSILSGRQGFPERGGRSPSRI